MTHYKLLSTTYLQENTDKQHEQAFMAADIAFWTKQPIKQTYTEERQIGSANRDSERIINPNQETVWTRMMITMATKVLRTMMMKMATLQMTLWSRTVR
jgi:hypothetical protein